MIRRDDLDAIRARWLAKQSDPSDLAAVLYLFDELEDAHERMMRERDEARAKLADLTNEWAARRCECGADDFCKIAQERNEARAEVERLRGMTADAFRRGAEAMRASCLQVDPYDAHGSDAHFARMMDSPASLVRIIHASIRALPIPGEP